MLFTNLKKMTHRTVAGLLAIWLSGVIFLICCEKINGKMADADMCPMAKMSVDCDKGKEPNLSGATMRNGSNLCLECAGIIQAVFNKSRRVETVQKYVAVSSTPVIVKFSAAALIGHTPAFVDSQARLPDKQRTFVRNCVFRI